MFRSCGAAYLIGGGEADRQATRFGQSGDCIDNEVRRNNPSNV
jgi:biotin synthase-related radical SAM superfamily protein